MKAGAAHFCVCSAVAWSPSLGPPRPSPGRTAISSSHKPWAGVFSHGVGGGEVVATPHSAPLRELVLRPQAFPAHLGPQILAFSLPGTFPETFRPGCPVKSWYIGNADYCSFCPPRLHFPLQKWFLAKNGIFSFGSWGWGWRWGTGLPPRSPEGLADSWAVLLSQVRALAHCCPTGTESGPAACWPHLASGHRGIWPQGRRSRHQCPG